MSSPLGASCRRSHKPLTAIVGSSKPIALSALSWLVLRAFPKASVCCQRIPPEVLPDTPDEADVLIFFHLAPSQPFPAWFNRLKGGLRRRRFVVLVEKADWQAVRLARLARHCSVLDASTEPLLRLCAGLRRAAAGHVYVRASVQCALAQRLPDPELLLTLAQRRVLEVIGTGVDDVQASVLLGIQPATVMTHRSHVMRKLGVRHRGELIRAAIRYGYVAIGSDGDLSPARRNLPSPS
jgi:DNA-binding NarL/FixJ family response regulator